MSKVKVLDRHHPAKFIYEDTLLEWARDSNNIWWQRVSFLAYARSKANGHAGFARGEIAAVLGTSRQQVGKSIAAAVRKGWLDSGSNTRCLVVPPHIVRGGVNNGNEFDPCVICGAGRRVRTPKVMDSPTSPVVSSVAPPAGALIEDQPEPVGEGSGVKCTVHNCGEAATARGLCDYCQQVELVVYAKESNLERARQRMELYVTHGDPKRSSILDREAK